MAVVSVRPYVTPHKLLNCFRPNWVHWICTKNCEIQDFHIGVDGEDEVLLNFCAV